MSVIATKVRTRGHWVVRIRPTEFIPERVPMLVDLEQAVRVSSVNLRGWDFPHVDFNSPIIRAADNVGQEIDWDRFVELWRAYKSGQFVSLGALWGDWRDQSTLWAPQPGWKPQQTLGIEDAVFRLVEIYEFAARWANATLFGESIVIDIKIVGLKGRTLEMSPGRAPFLRPTVATVSEWTSNKSCETSTLLSSARELAAADAIRLFELFGWDAKPDVIRDVQGQLRA